MKTTKKLLSLFAVTLVICLLCVTMVSAAVLPRSTVVPLSIPDPVGTDKVVGIAAANMADCTADITREEFVAIVFRAAWEKSGLMDNDVQAHALSCQERCAPGGSIPAYFYYPDENRTDKVTSHRMVCSDCGYSYTYNTDDGSVAGQRYNW